MAMKESSWKWMKRSVPKSHLLDNQKGVVESWYMRDTDTDEWIATVTEYDTGEVVVHMRKESYTTLCAAMDHVERALFGWTGEYDTDRPSDYCI